MADISITAASVLSGANAKIEDGIAGATITAGQLVYRDAATGRYLLSDANGAAAAKTVRGVALNGASAGQPLKIQKKGLITAGGTLTAGISYYLSDTPGGLCPVADVGTGEDYVFVGIATTTAILNLNPTASGVSA